MEGGASALVESIVRETGAIVCILWMHTLNVRHGPKAGLFTVPIASVFIRMYQSVF